MRDIKEINELFMLTVITALVGSYAFVTLGLDRGGYFVSLLYSQFILVLPTLIYVVKRKVNVKEMFRFHKIKAGTVFLSILFAYLIMPLMQEINLISMLFARNEITSKIYSVTEGKPFVVSAFVIAVIPAFLEESVYRGCFFNTYSKKSPLKGIFLSALFFGLMHLNFNQFSYAFAMGMIFCFLVEGTNSIFTSMIVHFVINCSSVVMIYLVPIMQKCIGAQTETASLFNQDVNTISTKSLLLGICIYGIIAAFTTVLAVLIYVVMIKHEGRLEHVKKMFQKGSGVGASEEKESFISMPLIIAIVICVAYMILNELV